MIPIFNLSIWFLVKIFFLIAIFLYFIFALVIVRQVNLMIDTVEVGFENVIRLIAWGNLLFAVGIFVLALMIL